MYYIKIGVETLKKIVENSSPKALALYTTLLTYKNNDTKICNPLEQTLASRLNCTERQIRTLVSELKNAGVIKTEKQNYNGKKRNYYYFTEE